MISSKLDKLGHELLGVESNQMAHVKELLNERQFFASQLCPNMMHFLKTQSESTIDYMVHNTLVQMDSCSKNCRTDEKIKTIAWLLRKICKALELDPDAVEPILTGSAAEYTQALFIDEFDYLLQTPKKLERVRFENRLRTIVSKIAGYIHHSRLAIESMTLDCEDSYPCLHIEWVDEQVPNTYVTIDLIPVISLEQSVTLPNHNFLPVSRDQQPDDRGSEQCISSHGQDAEIVNQNERSATTSNNVPRLFTEIHKGILGGIVYSQVENWLIKALPSHIIEGYRLAKAVRFVHVIKNIVHKLIDLGVTLNIKNVIRTYHLKTCVFYLTQNYVYDDSNIEGNNRWKWAIAIFEKLREFVVLGNVKEFFATEKYVFKGLYRYSYLECQHSKDSFEVALPKLICCRRRKARLLMVDQILSVLHE